MDDFFKIDRQSTLDISQYVENIHLPSRLLNILKTMQFSSEEKLFEEVDQLILSYTSHYLFPNCLIAFYPQLHEHHASYDISCNISGAVIKKGSIYYTYHPFMEDLKSGRVYTIKKKICVEYSYIDLFPQDLFTYEEWYYKLKNSYYQHDDIIDFYNLSVSCGEDCLEPYQLGFHKKRKR